MFSPRLCLLFLVSVVACTSCNNTVPKSSGRAVRALGKTNLENTQVPSINVTGPCKLSNTIVTENTKIVGSLAAKNSNLNQLNVTGPFSFNNVTVTGKTFVTGPVSNDGKGMFQDVHVSGNFNIDNVECSNLKVTGRVDAAQLTVRGNTNITGAAIVKNSSLQDLTITTEESTFKDSTIKNITVGANNAGASWFGSTSEQKEQTLILDGSTVVAGNITFEAGNGKVIIKNAQVKINGTVQGAVIVK